MLTLFKSISMFLLCSLLCLLLHVLHNFLKKTFPLLKIGGRGSRKLGVDRGGPPGLAAGGKYERSHMAKAQKLTSPKRT